ncbi:hypothetical protein NXC12_CH03985 [Rhizobium etli]|uniref:Uncharacterized protein n=1 Tax=Rhizobium etli TaxID=29449 RepID=A0AAN1ELN8_RHIET|nr:hypothetical protein NXC12_CH03985 [Rhizobium etli]
MVDRLARVVAQLYGQAGRSISPARFSQPERPGIFPPGSEAIGSNVPGGMPIANRLCPDENLLRQNDSS